MSQRISIKYINQSGAVDGEVLVYNASLDEWVPQSPEAGGLINWTETSGHILPNTNDTYDIGSSALKIRDLYMSGSTIHLGTQSISSDADGIKMPSIKIGTGGNEISLTASSDGKLIQTAKVGGVTQTPVTYTIGGLDDTNITTAVDGNVLSYDVGSSKWINSIPIDAYTKSEVDSAISGLVDSAPEALNTLNELAAALGDNADHVTTITTLIGTKSDSAHTHDYAPTAHTHDLSNYDTSSEVDTKISNVSVDLSGYDTSAQVDTKIASIPDGASVIISDTPPVTPSAGDLWTNSLDMSLNIYYVDSTSSQWVDLNQTDIDLSGYDTSSQVDTKISNVSVDLSGYDTSAQVDTKIAAIPGADLSAYDTSSQVDTKVAGIVDSAPETLNTLNELAAALGDDANHVTTMTTLVGTKADASHTHDYAPTVHTHDLSNYDTSSEVDTKIAAIPGADLSGYDTSSEVDTKISNVSVDLSGYDTSSEVDTKIESLTVQSVSSGSVSAGDTLVLNSNGTVSPIQIVLNTDTPENVPITGTDGQIDSAEWKLAHISFSPDNPDKVVSLHVDNNTIYLKVGHVSNGIVVWNNLYNVGGADNEISYSVSYAPNNKVLIMYYDRWQYKSYIILGTITSSNTYYQTSTTNFGASGWGVSISADPYSSNKVVATYNASGGTYVRTYDISSGLSLEITSLLSEVGTDGAPCAVAWDKNNIGKFILAFNTAGPNAYSPNVLENYLMTGVVGDNSLSFGTPIVFYPSPGNIDKLNLTYTNTPDKFLIGYGGTIKIGTVSGESISLHGETYPGGGFRTIRFLDYNRFMLLYNTGSGSGNMYYITGTYDTNTDTVLFNSPISITTQYSTGIFGFDMNSNGVFTVIFQSSNSGWVTWTVSGQMETVVSTSNLNVKRFIGISDNNYSDNQTVEIQSLGSVSKSQSGLSIDEKYYVQIDGSLTNVNEVDSVYAGIAISTTKLLLDFETNSIDLSVYDTSAEVDTKISNVSVDLSAYDTSSQVDTKISNVSVDLSGYDTSIQVDTKIGAISSGSQIEFTATSQTEVNDVVMLNTDGTVTVVTPTTYSTNSNVATGYMIANSGGENDGVSRDNDGYMAGFPNDTDKYISYYERGSSWYSIVLSKSGSFAYSSETNLSNIDGISGDPYIHVNQDDDTKVLMVYTDGSGLLKTIQGTILGTLVTWGSPISHPDGLVVNGHKTRYDFTNNIDQKLIVSWNDAGILKVLRISWDGTNIVYSDPLDIISSVGQLDYDIGWDYNTEGRFVTHTGDDLVGGLIDWGSGSAVVGGGTAIAQYGHIIPRINPISGHIVCSYWEPGVNHRALTVGLFSMDSSYTITYIAKKYIGTRLDNSIPISHDLEFMKNSNVFILPRSQPVLGGTQGWVDIISSDTSGFTVLSHIPVYGSSSHVDGQTDPTGTISIHPTLSGQGSFHYTYKYHAGSGYKYPMYARFVQGEYTESNLDASKLIGISGSSGTTIDVTLDGGIHTGFSGLTSNSKYYVLADGSLSTTPDSYNAKVGLALTNSTISVDFIDELTSASLGTYATKSYVDTNISNVSVDLSAYDTSSQVDTKIASIVDSAPATLDTLNELAAALGDDANHVTTMTTLIGTKSDASHDHNGHYYLKSEVDSAVLSSWTEDVNGHIVPNTNDTYDIGSSTLKVRDIYMSGSTIHLGDQTISADADGIRMPSIKIGTGGNEISLTASSDGKLVQTRKVGGVTQSPVTYTIDGLDDTNITTPVDGNVLSYDVGSSKWINSIPIDAYTKTEVDTEISNASGGGGASVVISDTAPASPSAGDLWTNSSTMALNIFYVDSDSSQWVELTQTEVDLAGVYTAVQVDTKIDEIPIKKLTNVTTVLNVSSVLDSFDMAMDSCKYIVKVKSSADKYITEILLLHNGVDAFITEYGIIDTSTDWVTLSSSIVGSNVELSIITTVNATVELTKII